MLKRHQQFILLISLNQTSLSDIKICVYANKPQISSHSFLMTFHIVIYNFIPPQHKHDFKKLNIFALLILVSQKTLITLIRTNFTVIRQPVGSFYNSDQMFLYISNQAKIFNEPILLTTVNFAMELQTVYVYCAPSFNFFDAN